MRYLTYMYEYRYAGNFTSTVSLANKTGYGILTSCCRDFTNKICAVKIIFSLFRSIGAITSLCLIQPCATIESNVHTILLISTYVKCSKTILPQHSEQCYSNIVAIIPCCLENCNTN